MFASFFKCKGRDILEIEIVERIAQLVFDHREENKESVLQSLYMFHKSGRDADMPIDEVHPLIGFC